MLAAIEVDAATVTIGITVLAGLVVFLNKIADHLIIPMAKDYWGKRAERRVAEAKARGETVVSTPKREQVSPCPLTEAERVSSLDKVFGDLAEKDPQTGLPRWFSPPDWKERMDNQEAALFAMHDDLREIVARHDSCNSIQTAAVVDHRAEVDRLNAKLDTVQSERLADERRWADRILAFASTIEQGMNDDKTGSRRSPVVVEPDDD